jgi:hypothetical protein
VDSGGDLWLNSIDASDLLANQKYKRIPINKNSNHASNLFRFYDNGSTPSKISFAVGTSIRNDVMARDLKDQYDFDLYTSGAKYVSSQYLEKFSYFAPLYLDKILPEYFVIFKVSGASTYTTGQWYQNLQDPNFGQSKFTEDFFKNAMIVKSVSLKETSNLGTYLRNIQQNPLYPENPLYVNFKNDGYSLYRGVSIKSGTYVEIPEIQDEVLRRSIPQLELEKYITGGFERSNVIYPKILNLEFLFDDDSSSEYSINRYFGLYCNAIDLTHFDIDLAKMYDNDADNDNVLPSLYTRYDDVSFKLTNPNGVVLRGESVVPDLSFISQALGDPNSLMFPYMRTKDDELHFIKTNNTDLQSQAFTQVKTNITFAVDATTFDIGKTFGPHTLFSQETAQEVVQDTRTTVMLQIVEAPSHLDTLRVYHEAGTTFDPLDSNGTYDDIVFVSDYFNSDEEYSLEYPEIKTVAFYLSGTNDPNDISQTFSPNIKATSTDSVSMDIDSITFTVDDVTPFEVGARVKVRSTESYGPSSTPGEIRFMLGDVSALDADLSTITINTTYQQGQGTYSSWIIERHELGVQYISVGEGADGSIWHSNGSDFVPGAVGSRIYVNIDNAVIDFDPSSTPQGSVTDTSKLAKTVSTIIGELYLTHLVSVNHKNTTFIQSRPFGNTYRSLALKNVSDSPAFLINGKAGTEIVWADGGSLKPQVIIPGGNISRLTPLLDNLVVRTHENWSRINRVCQSAAYVNNNTGGLTDQSAPNYLSRATLVIGDKERVKVNYNKVEIRNVFRPSIGVLSMFELKDLDFTTYTSDYSKIPELDLYQYYWIPEGATILDFTEYVYQLFGSGSIKVNDETYEAGLNGTIVWQPIEGRHKYSVLTGNPVLVKSIYRPGSFDNFDLRTAVVSIDTEDFLFEVGESITAYVSETDAVQLISTFADLQVGTYGTSTDPIDLSTYTEDNLDYEFSITIQPGLDFTGVERIRIFGNLDNYLDGVYLSYNSSTGLLSYQLAAWTGTSELSSWDVFSINEDETSLAGYRDYRIYKFGVNDSYIDAKLKAVERTPATPSNSFPRALFEIIGVSGQLTTGSNWILAAKYPIYSNVRSDIAILDEDGNLKNFTGFFGLGADHALPSTTAPTYQYREKYKTNSLTSEYNVYLENFSSNFSIDSKLVPYISKWGITNSTDARGNSYRLNSDILFGKDNFGPSHRETIPTAEKLTHEWFYIESKFNYEFDQELTRKNYYYFDSPIDVNRLISDPGYFETYFTYIPTFSGNEVDRAQFRYSKLIKNQFTNQYETIFNGAKFVFSELNGVGAVLPNTTRFDDYNFSILLKPVNEDLSNPQSPIKYRIIENTDAKSILVLIEVALSGKDRISSDLLLNSNKEYLSTATLNQANLFKIGYLTEADPYSIQIDSIYTTTDDSAGDAEFNKFKLDEVSDLSTLTGTAIDAITSQSIESFSLEAGKHILVIKGSDTVNQFLLAMQGSEVFNLSNSSKIKEICALDVIGPDLYGPSSTPAGSVKFYQVSNSKRIIVDNLSYRTTRLIGETYEIDRNDSNQIKLRVVTPSWKSVFGDFRLEFSENGVSNLTYGFLYSVKDKKYNSVKSSFSTVKLAKGISLSLDSAGNKTETASLIEYTLASKTLNGLPESSFTLNNFVNPISGGGDGTPAFAPIMMIDSKGHTSILLSTSTDFDLDKTTLADLVEGLSSSRITNHSIKSVSEAGLVISTSKAPTNMAFPLIVQSTGSLVNMSSASYIGVEVRLPLLSSAASQYKVGDYVRLSHSSLDSGNYLLAKISADSSVTNSPNTIRAIPYYQNSGAQPDTTSFWFISTSSPILAVSPTVQITGELTASVTASKTNYPVIRGGDATWITNNQQFQLFGGKEYFAKLFGNLSFANFIKLTETNSEIMIWETYTAGQRVRNSITSDKIISIQVEPADLVEKSTIVVPIPENVETGEGVRVGGYNQSERAVPKYELFRYSGEYDVIFRPVAGFNYQNQIGEFSLPGSNTRLNPDVTNFFVLPEHYYVKYSDTRILDLEESTKFSARYPLISESPIDYTRFNVLSSSWDFNYHYKYSDKSTKTAIAGTNRITEDYSFVSKLINLPLELTLEPSGFQELTKAQFDVSDQAFDSTGIDFAYAVYDTEIRVKLNVKRLIAKRLLSNGLSDQFNNFFKDLAGDPIVSDPGLIGDLTLSQYKIEYCQTNLSKLYKVSTLDFYSKPNYSLSDNLISFTQVSYDQLADLDYSPFNGIQINNLNSTILSGSIPKGTSTGISLVPKLKIKYI